MEIIVCALKQEADAIRQILGNDARIEICGVGAKNLGFINKMEPNDHLINFGICAGTNVGSMYLCNKIIGDKDYYPDMLLGSQIKQMPITCMDKVVSADIVSNNKNMLFDMESAVIYKAASKILSPHQMSFLKIVSDTGSPNLKEIHKQIINLVQNNFETIRTYVRLCNEHFDCNNASGDTNVAEYSQILKCSVSMENRLKQQIRYAKITCADVDKFFNKLKQDKKIPVEHKKDGVKILDKLDEFLIGGSND